MEVLPGFAWPLPRAFAAAVSTCRFEQGDVLYDVPEGYASWGPGPGRWVQVLDPPRTARTAPADALGNRFAANWGTPVTVELGVLRPSSKRVVHCTQGRLFTCVWRGDPDLLRDVPPGTPEALPLPGVARDLQKELASAVPALRRASHRDPHHSTAFVCVVDEASEASLAKARAIASALSDGRAGEARGRAARHASSPDEDVEIVDLAPAEAGIPSGEGFHPTLRVRAFVVASDEPAKVEARLKRALYGGGQDGSRDADPGGTDRFKLDRHGLLVAPEGPAGVPERG